VRIGLLTLETGLSDLRSRFAQPLSVLLAMVGMLLVIACANVASLLLSRAAARRHELAMRAAIGAGRGRLVRQLLTESMVIAAVAGVAGTLMASWMTRALLALMPDGSVGSIDLTIDRRVLVFAFVASAAAALIAGVAPAWLAMRFDAGVSRARPAIGSRGGWIGRAFVIAQVALSLTIVIGAGLLARTLFHLSRLDPGFDLDGVVAAQVEPGARGYSDARLRQYFGEVERRLRETPGVTRVTLAQFGFLSGSATTGPLETPGSAPASDADRMMHVYQVGAGFFTTLGVTVVQGRDFEERDLTGPPVAALNESAARKLFGDLSPIGRTILSSGRPLEVIAVTRDARANTLRDEPVPTFFVPYTRALRGRMTFVTRVTDETAGARSVLHAIRGVDEGVPMTLTTITELRARNMARERLLAVLAGAFAGTAVFLLALGLYGVMAFWVGQRRSEIGVRLALGSSRAAVMWRVLRQPVGFVVAGSVIGLALTLAGGRAVAALLFGLAPSDPPTLAAAVGLLAIVGISAGYGPARRASRVDPAIALRCE
jgi:predicted permease